MIALGVFALVAGLGLLGLVALANGMSDNGERVPRWPGWLLVGAGAAALICSKVI